MGLRTTRREFMIGSAGVVAAACLARGIGGAGGAVPRVDLHVHLDNSSIEQVLPLSEKLGVKFGIVEHAGTKENKYPVVLSNDHELRAYLKMLEGKNVWRGVQAEWIDWAGCFSKEAMAELDFALGDAMTFPDAKGQRTKLWEKGIEERIDLSNADKFMDQYVDWHVQVIATTPIEVFANTTFTPPPLMGRYDELWTAKRFLKVVEAAKKHKVALEISSSYKLPTLRLLKLAREAGAVFSFGSNGRYPKMGQIDYSLEMAKELGLTAEQVFVPGKGKRRA